MNKKNKILAIIPARGGSKRLPNKNILPLSNKPMISWTIEAALKCKSIDKIIVSSDSDEILNIASTYNGVHALKRDKKLSTDTTTTIDVVKHILQIENEYSHILLLQPTSPLRTSNHIENSVELLYSKKADAIISVCEAEHSPFWMNTLKNNNSMDSFISKEIKNKRSQDLEPYFRLNGAIYLVKTDRLIEENSFLLSSNIFAYVMDAESSIDIDTLLDFDLAQVVFNRLRSKKNNE